ncbi:hypothetical protein MHB40_19585 [Lysinibacillus sp. FSL K6-0057]|jgi:thiol-disulfide isomerase/thioredoxin|uniref:peroxiredoxin family protein n=1 Tax=unclassified Lysinibacillus TaxID=2636778 RepID=UPI003158B3D6
MDKLPNINLYNFDGALLELNNAFREKEVLFVFVSLYCKRCIELLPDIEGLLQHGLDLVLITNGEVEDNYEMVKYFGWTFPVLTMTNSNMAEYFHVYETPAIRIYNNQGLLLNQGIINVSSDILFYIKNMDSQFSKRGDV